MFGAVMVLVTASGIFGEMQTALNTTWEVEGAGRAVAVADPRARGKPRPCRGARLCDHRLACRERSAFRARPELAMRTPVGSVVLTVLNTGLSLAVFALLFAAIYKVLPDTPLRWRDVAPAPSSPPRFSPAANR